MGDVPASRVFDAASPDIYLACPRGCGSFRMPIVRRQLVPRVWGHHMALTRSRVMSRKVTSVTANDIRKSVSIANSSHPAQSEKPDFKLKKVTGAKSAFGV